MDSVAVSTGERWERREEGPVFSRLMLMPSCHLLARGHHEHLGFLSEIPSHGSPLGLDPSPPVNSQI